MTIHTQTQGNLFHWAENKSEYKLSCSAKVGLVSASQLVDYALLDMFNRLPESDNSKLGNKLWDKISNDLAIEEQAERELLERESHLEVLGMDFEASTAYWEAREMEDGNEPF